MQKINAIWDKINLTQEPIFPNIGHNQQNNSADLEKKEDICEDNYEDDMSEKEKVDYEREEEENHSKYESNCRYEEREEGNVFDKETDMKMEGFEEEVMSNSYYDEDEDVIYNDDYENDSSLEE